MILSELCSLPGITVFFFILFEFHVSSMFWLEPRLELFAVIPAPATVTVLTSSAILCPPPWSKAASVIADGLEPL